jgi:hypothetical protein
MLGHCGSDRLGKTVKIHDFLLESDFKTYELCAIAKARQKNVKNLKGASQVHGELLYLVISSFKDLRFGESKFWPLFFDHLLNHSWRIFLKNNSDLKIKIFIF